MTAKNGTGKKKQLGRSLLLKILLMAILPLLLLSVVSYKYVSDQAQETAIENLQSLTLLQSKSISQYFERVLQDLMLESDRLSNVELLQTLEQSYHASNKPLDKFVSSYSWVKIVSEKGTDLELFWKTYGYSDVLLIDIDGNILYSLQKKSGLGSNVFLSDSKNSKFAQNLKKTFDKGDVRFSDLEFYPARNESVGFFINSLLDEDGEKIGALVFEINRDSLNKLIATQVKNIETGELDIFLVGTDRVIRSNSKNSQKKKNGKRLAKLFEAVEIDAWFERNIENGKVIDSNLEPIFYLDSQKGEVIAVLTPVEIANTLWIVVAEVEARQVNSTTNTLIKVFSLLTLISLAAILIAAVPMTRNIVRPILQLTEGVRQASQGNLEARVNLNDETELSELAEGYNNMLFNLKRNKQDALERDWLEKGVGTLNELTRGAKDRDDLSEKVLTMLVRYLVAQVGTFYRKEDNELRLTASFGVDENNKPNQVVQLGAGLVGQVALEKQALELNNLPEQYLNISSSLGQKSPASLLIYPLVYKAEVLAVIEIGWLDELPEKAGVLLEMVTENVAITLSSLEQHENVIAMLKQSQSQSKELQTQQEELRVTNDALSSKSEALNNQQKVLEKAHNETEEKAKALEEASKYKSEFLANMSHELRTPLNSLLILSRMLAQNDDGNLSNDEVESAQVIQESGRSLLELINEILDLSKVEAGQMVLIAETLSLSELAMVMNRRFKHMAEDKQIFFKVRQVENIVDSFVSDGTKLMQILTNLISNALKFTETGGVILDISIVLGEGLLAGHREILNFCVEDSGVGIAEDKQQAVFEAFQQVDGTTSRTHGGTGLGLSIALSFARLLGGDIELESTLGKGSKFNLYLPLKRQDNVASGAEQKKKLNGDTEFVRPIDLSGLKSSPPPFEDDRNRLQAGKRLILLVEDDPNFSKIVFDACHRQQCQMVVAADGETGLILANQYPINAIILDYMLPQLDGREVLSKIRLNPKLKHLPVHMISAFDNLGEMKGLSADELSTKPITNTQLVKIISSLSAQQTILDILIVENDSSALFALKKLFEKENINCAGVDNAKQAILILQQRSFDAIVLDLNLNGMSGFEFLDSVSLDQSIHMPNIFIYSGRELSQDELNKLARFTTNIIVKSARSHERLLDEIHLFANQLAGNTVAGDTAELAGKSAQMKSAVVGIKDINGSDLDLHDIDLKNRTVLLVDDDMRNTFALAKVLRKNKLNVRLASSGQQSLDMLAEYSDIELVLMDIMMPGMDGYEAMAKIRSQPAFRDLAVIAVTANAMPGDQDKCIQAGANDYLAKPIDVGQLLTMMKLWV